MARHYRFLSFQAGIDWKDVNPKLLNRLNRLGMKLHETITVSSGYRSREEQARLYQRYVASGYDIRYIAAKPGHSMHEQGLAVDAEINGTALSKAVSKKTLASFGLTAPVKGDYPHIQLLGGATGKAPAAVSSSPSQTMDTAAASPVAGSVPQYLPPGSPPQPEETHPSVYAPGAAGVGGFTPQSAPSTWQELASMPLSSPETQLYAQRAGG